MSSSLNKIKKSLMSAMQSANKQGTSAYDTTAVVRRIEGDIAWVHIAGGVDETPVKLTIAAKAGDSVQVRVGGGRAWITGNATAPPTDDQKANEANDKATAADVKAGRALKDASDAMDEAKSAQDEANQLAINMANAVVRINADIENLQDQIDGNITTWFFDYDPTNSNMPASEWIAEGTESAHIGDLFYNNTSGYSWRWQVTNGAYSWQRVTDTDVAKALADAAKAQDTADSKRRVFYTQPVPPYDKGDLWVQGSGGDILRCAQDKVEGQVYVASDWVLASKYTDDSTLNNWLANTYAADKTSIQNQIDGKAETWYQAADPATNWTAAEKQKHEGDLWYRTSDGTTWYYTGSAWNQQQVPTSVFNAIDGKANIFVGDSTPASPKDGDLWMQSASSDILTYVGGRWVKYNKYTDDTVANEAKATAEATKLYFWTDSSGAHITRKTQQEYIANPAAGGSNILINNTGFIIRDGLTELAKFTQEAAQIGKDTGQHLKMTPNQLEFYASYGSGEDLLARLVFTSDDGDFPVATFIQAGDRYGIEYMAGGHHMFARTSEVVFAPGLHTRMGFDLAPDLFRILSNTYVSEEEGAPTVIAMQLLPDGSVSFAGSLSCDGVTCNSLAVNGSSRTNGNAVVTGSIVSNSGITAKGGINAGGNFNVGERAVNISNESHSWASSTNWVSLDEVTLNKGSYILVGEIRYPSNSSGRRGVRWYNESASEAVSHSSVVVSATSGVCYIQSVALVSVGSSGAVMRLQGMQNSGDRLSVTTYARGVAFA